jgi:hypothetical protein
LQHFQRVVLAGGGGIILACSQDFYSINNAAVRQFSVTVDITNRANNETWTLTGVYGPQAETDKTIFMQEIELIKQSASDRWLLLGDINLIYRASDKSTGRINRGLMNRFRHLLDGIEIHLHGRRFTWTSGTQAPTQTKIDHVFASKDWELIYPTCHLHAAETLVSDHCPMILTGSPSYRRYKGFRFESYWLRVPEFKEVVAQNWARPTSTANKVRLFHSQTKKVRLFHIKLLRLAKTLRNWQKRIMADSKREAQQLVLQLE